MSIGCPACGKPLPTKSPGSSARRKTCSDECSAAWRRRRDAEKHRRKRAANPEKARALGRAWRAANPDEVRANERKRSASAERKGYERKRLLRRMFGLTVSQFEAMLSRQASACAICGRVEPVRKGWTWSVDHDHATGKVRGLLCLTCNTGLGLLRDSPDLMLKGAEYLEGHAKRTR